MQWWTGCQIQQVILVSVYSCAFQNRENRHQGCKTFRAAGKTQCSLRVPLADKILPKNASSQATTCSLQTATSIVNLSVANTTAKTTSAETTVSIV